MDIRSAPMCACPTLEDAPDGPLLFARCSHHGGSVRDTWNLPWRWGTAWGARKGRAKKWWDFASFNGAETPKQWWFIDKWVPGMVSGEKPWKNHMSSDTPADNPWFDFYRVSVTVQHIEDYHHNLRNPSQPESDDRGFWIQPDPWNITNFRVPAWIVSLCLISMGDLQDAKIEVR